MLGGRLGFGFDVSQLPTPPFPRDEADAAGVGLAADRQRYLQGLPDLEDLGLLVHNGKVSGLVKDYLENFWNPIPTDRDTKKLRVEYLNSEQSNPLAVAYVLSGSPAMIVRAAARSPSPNEATVVITDPSSGERVVSASGESA